MCTVSMVMDHYRDKINEYVTTSPNTVTPGFLAPGYISPTSISPLLTAASAWQVDQLRTAIETNNGLLVQLKADMEEMKKLVKRALKYDADNNEPHCELDEKIDLIKKVAEMVGVDVSDLKLGEKEIVVDTAAMAKTIVPGAK